MFRAWYGASAPSHFKIHCARRCIFCKPHGFFFECFRNQYILCNYTIFCFVKNFQFSPLSTFPYSRVALGRSRTARAEIRKQGLLFYIKRLLLRRTTSDEPYTHFWNVKIFRKQFLHTPVCLSLFRRRVRTHDKVCVIHLLYFLPSRVRLYRNKYLHEYIIPSLTHCTPYPIIGRSSYNWVGLFIS